MDIEFDGKKYKLASKHQKEWGKELISELSFKGNETVLDLGCGDGILTEQLSFLVPYGKALGIDASINMIETAKMLCKNNLDFIHMNINEINFENEFDFIFSNAALHWVKDHKQLLKNIYRALKTHGIIVFILLMSFRKKYQKTNIKNILKILNGRGLCRQNHSMKN